MAEGREGASSKYSPKSRELSYSICEILWQKSEVQEESKHLSKHHNDKRPSTGDFRDSKDANVADLREQILLEVYLFGLRVHDVSRPEWKTFAANSEPPIPVMINCAKEETVAHVFLNEEFKALLDKYLATIDKENPYLFQSKNRQGTKRKGIHNMSSERILSCALNV